MLSHLKHVRSIIFFFLPPSPDCRNGGKQATVEQIYFSADMTSAKE